MKIIFSLFAVFLVAASAANVSKSTCELKNVKLQEALKKLAIERLPAPKEGQLDCSACYDDILAAAFDCILSFNVINCIFDIIDGASPCKECVCEVIVDIGGIFGQDWHC